MINVYGKEEKQQLKDMKLKAKQQQLQERRSSIDFNRRVNNSIHLVGLKKSKYISKEIFITEKTYSNVHRFDGLKTNNPQTYLYTDFAELIEYYSIDKKDYINEIEEPALRHKLTLRDCVTRLVERKLLDNDPRFFTLEVSNLTQQLLDSDTNIFFLLKDFADHKVLISYSYNTFDLFTFTLQEDNILSLDVVDDYESLLEPSFVSHYVLQQKLEQALKKIDGIEKLYQEILDGSLNASIVKPTARFSEFMLKLSATYICMDNSFRNCLLSSALDFNKDFTELNNNSYWFDKTLLHDTKTTKKYKDWVSTQLTPISISSGSLESTLKAILYSSFTSTQKTEARLIAVEKAINDDISTLIDIYVRKLDNSITRKDFIKQISVDGRKKLIKSFLSSNHYKHNYANIFTRICSTLFDANEFNL